MRDALTLAQWNVDSLVVLSERHQKRYGQAIPLQAELEAALRRLKELCSPKLPVSP